MTRALHLAGYKFVDLPDAAALRDPIEARARTLGLRGTVLLAGEGINLALAGDAAALGEFMAWLRTDPRLTDLAVRETAGDGSAFGRLRVRVKREIIRMDCPQLRPADARAPAVAPATLARWLARGSDDDGRPLAMLDTRNAFEVDRGAFEGAIDWRLARFGDFPAALRARRAELEGRTVVAYCTGGIRCEKAVLLMRAAGVPHALQLEGGVLGYFEQAEGAPHWRGDCVVFDGRGALDTRLRPA